MYPTVAKGPQRLIATNKAYLGLVGILLGAFSGGHGNVLLCATHKKANGIEVKPC